MWMLCSSRLLNPTESSQAAAVRWRGENKLKEKKIVLVLDPLALPLSALEKINTIRTLIKLEPSKENFIISGQV